MTVGNLSVKSCCASVSCSHKRCALTGSHEPGPTCRCVCGPSGTVRCCAWAEDGRPRHAARRALLPDSGGAMPPRPAAPGHCLSPHRAWARVTLSHGVRAAWTRFRPPPRRLGAGQFSFLSQLIAGPPPPLHVGTVSPVPVADFCLPGSHPAPLLPLASGALLLRGLSRRRLGLGPGDGRGGHTWAPCGRCPWDTGLTECHPLPPLPRTAGLTPRTPRTTRTRPPPTIPCTRSPSPRRTQGATRHPTGRRPRPLSTSAGRPPPRRGTWP